MNSKDVLVPEPDVAAHDGIEISPQANGSTAPTMGARRLCLAAFSIYAVGLLAFAVYKGNRNEAIEMPLWDLQDTRRLVAWLATQAGAGLFKVIRYMLL